MYRVNVHVHAAQSLFKDDVFKIMHLDFIIIITLVIIM